MSRMVARPFGERAFNPKTDVTLECPCCRAYKICPRPSDLPTDVIMIEIICPERDDGDRHAETWYSAPGVEVSQDRERRRTNRSKKLSTQRPQNA